MKINYKQAREDLRKWLVKYTHNCILQKGIDKKSYPCGTCTTHLLARIGLRDYDEINKVWQAILQIRETKLK